MQTFHLGQFSWSAQLWFTKHHKMEFRLSRSPFFTSGLGDSNILRCTLILTLPLSHVSWFWWETLPVRNHWGM